jgi:hypothetical protein
MGWGVSMGQEMASLALAMQDGTRMPGRSAGSAPEKSDLAIYKPLQTLASLLLWELLIYCRHLASRVQGPQVSHSS